MLLGELGPHSEGSGGLPNLGAIGALPLYDHSDPVPSLENSGAPSSNYIWVLITSHHLGPIHQPSPGALVTATASPLTPRSYPSPLSSLMSPRSLGERGNILTTYEVPGKLTMPICPALSPASPSPCPTQPAPPRWPCCCFLDTPGRLPPQGSCMCCSFGLKHTSF